MHQHGIYQTSLELKYLNCYSPDLGEGAAAAFTFDPAGTFQPNRFPRISPREESTSFPFPLSNLVTGLLTISFERIGVDPTLLNRLKVSPFVVLLTTGTGFNCCLLPQADAAVDSCEILGDRVIGVAMGMIPLLNTGIDLEDRRFLQGRAAVDDLTGVGC